MKSSKIALSSKILLLITGALLLGALMFPIWKIELDAPQYPEGLELKLHANKLGGDVEIINGLNHYIGMKTLHTENFVEFTVLPYIIGAFGVFSLLMILVAKKKGVLALFVSLILFGILAGIDFYRWNYEYGHDLDPNAAIKVPGMAYQPPVLGYKQLLNFGAYSIPDTGGWMLIGAGFLLFLIVCKETKVLSRFKKKSGSTTAIIALSFLVLSCGSNEPKPIKLHQDGCDFCKMTISDGKFGAELITKKGRYYKFDDVSCMILYSKTNSVEAQSYFVSNYVENNQLLPAEKSFYIKGETVMSPMRGNVAAFSSETTKNEYQSKLEAESLTWEQLYNSFE
jgi:copper chaperone NosL